MKVLITGGAGYLGTELVRHLAPQPDISQIVIYDNLSRSNFNLFLGDEFESKNKIRLIQADILDSRTLEKSVQGSSVLFHLAARVTTPFANVDAHGFEQINHWGSAAVVNAIEKFEVPKAVYMSSASVYGPAPKAVDESVEPKPHTFYGISKANGETHFQRIFDKCQCLVLRCGNVFGFGNSLRLEGVINNFLFNANFKRRIKINGDGSQVRSFTNIENATSVLANIWRTNYGSGVYNLVEAPFSINEIVDHLLKIYPDLETIHVNRDLKLEHSNVLPNLRVNKLMTAPKENLLDGLQRFASHFSF